MKEFWDFWRALIGYGLWAGQGIFQIVCVGGGESLPVLRPQPLRTLHYVYDPIPRKSGLTNEQQCPRNIEKITFSGNTQKFVPAKLDWYHFIDTFYY